LANSWVLPPSRYVILTPSLLNPSRGGSWREASHSRAAHMLCRSSSRAAEHLAISMTAVSASRLPDSQNFCPSGELSLALNPSSFAHSEARCLWLSVSSGSMLIVRVPSGATLYERWKAAPPSPTVFFPASASSPCGHGVHACVWNSVLSAVGPNVPHSGYFSLSLMLPSQNSRQPRCHLA